MEMKKIYGIHEVPVCDPKKLFISFFQKLSIEDKCALGIVDLDFKTISFMELLDIIKACYLNFFIQNRKTIVEITANGIPRLDNEFHLLIRQRVIFEELELSGLTSFMLSRFNDYERKQVLTLGIN